MSSINRNVTKEAPPRPEVEIVSRHPVHCGFTSLEKFGSLSIFVSFSADGDDAIEFE